MAEGVTWKVLATMYPEFVQWAVQKHGPLPEGLVEEELYASLSAEYMRLSLST